jgi:hypothetical protein
VENDTTPEVRATLRCLRDDLRLEVDGPALISEIDHPILEKAASFAPAYPQNVVRFQAIPETLVFRFTHGRARVLTWLDRQPHVLWVLAVDDRNSDTYELFEDLHRQGDLLPNDDDRDQHEQERALRLVRAINTEVPRWVSDARNHSGEERAYELLPGGPAGIMLVRKEAGVEEVWCALPTLRAPVLGLPPKARELILAVLTEELGGVDTPWEQRFDWPSRELRDYDVAYFWLAAT